MSNNTPLNQKIMKTEILTYQTTGRKIIFEPINELPNGFIEAKKWLNSRSLESGIFPELCVNKQFVRAASTEEIDEYTALKDRSKYALNAD